MRLLVFDGDKQYARMLARAIRESEWRRKVTVVLAGGAGEEGVPAEALNRISDADLVLADEAWCTRLLEITGGITLVCLSEHREPEEITLGDKKLPCLFKYQSVHDLMTRLMERLAKPRGGMAGTGSGPCRLAVVYSASGGAGKTTFAAGLAEWLAAAGCRTLYLNLERIPSFPGGAPGESRRFARVLYHMRRGEHDALLSLAIRHPDSGFDWFPAADHADEWNEYGGADIRDLLDLIRQSGRWDFIVADCESALTELTETVIRLADDRFWLEPDDEFGARKAAFAHRMLAEATGIADREAWHRITVRAAPPGEEPDFAACLKMLGAEGDLADE